MNEFSFVALGGQDELNSDFFALEFNNSIFLIDSGLEVPMQANYGIKYYIPKMKYLEKNKDKIKGIFITSGVYEKIGALEYVLKIIPNLNIYGSKITLKLLKIYFGEESDKWNLIAMKNKEKNIIGNISVIPFLISSTMPGSYGYQFKSKESNIVFISGYVFDSIREYNIPVWNIYPNPKEKVTTLISDSKLGSKPISAEYHIKNKIETKIKDNNFKTFLTIYESNIFNIVEVIDIARTLQRKVFFTNKTTYDVITLLMKNKIINNFKYEFLKEGEEFSIPKDAIIIFSENKANLFKGAIEFIKNAKLLFDFEFSNRDLVVIASVPESGNEHHFSSLQSTLSSITSNILKIPVDSFREMHPNSFDLKNYLQIISPKYFIPIKGLYKDQIQMQKVFIESGNQATNFLFAYNGQKISFEDNKLIGISPVGKEFGKIIIEDSKNKNKSINENVVNERIELGKNGIVTISIIVSSKNKEIITNPDIQLRGVIFLKNENSLLTELQNKFIELIKFFFHEDEIFDKNKVVQKTSKEITKILKQRIKKTPTMVIKLIDKDAKK